MTNSTLKNKQEFLLKRLELIKKLRKNAAIFQFLAVLFLGVGLGLDIWISIKKIENIYLTWGIIVLLVVGVAFQIAALIYFSKTKKHLTGQIIQAPTNPKYWN